MNIKCLFFTADILTCQGRKSTDAANNINNGSVLFKCPSEPWQPEQSQDPKTEAAKWNLAITDFIIYTCAFPTVT